MERGLKALRALLALFLLALLWLGAALGMLAAILVLPWLIKREPSVWAAWEVIDRLCNVVIFRGNPRETVSLHAGRLLRAEDHGGPHAPRWAHWVDRMTSIVDDDHVRDSVRPGEMG